MKIAFILTKIQMLQTVRNTDFVGATATPLRGVVQILEHMKPSRGRIDAYSLPDNHGRVVFGFGDYRLYPSELADRNNVSLIGHRPTANLFERNKMRCFLDIDGVIANFGKRACEALGIPYQIDNPYFRDWYWYRNFGISDAEFDSVCGIDFWAGIQWMPDGKDIFALVECTFDDIYLLTTPMPNPGSGTGKILWVERHLPKYKKRLITTQAPKSLFARPNIVLIDDKDENIAEFMAAGGMGILVPRPWNELAGWANKTLEVVRNSLENFTDDSPLDTSGNKVSEHRGQLPLNLAGVPNSEKGKVEHGKS